MTDAYVQRLEWSRTSGGRRRELISLSNRGGVTLVLGAGISMARGLPNWDALAQDMWREAFGRRRSPWRTPTKGKSPREVPQFLPIVFELAYHELGVARFFKILRGRLYKNARFPNRDPEFRNSDETLAVLARLIRQELRRGRNRRIDAIVTLNADDLLEQAIYAVFGKGSRYLVPVVARSTHIALRRDRLPVYHVHGFLPSNKHSRYFRHFGDFFDYMLVFTDAQYWSTSATALAFANRVMLSVLNESHCVFIGLSMTDINLLRWLALRTLERDRDASELPEDLEGWIELVFRRHFWIRAKSDDPTGFLSEFLAVRGIHAVEIKGWQGPDFRRLIEKCFPKA